MSGLPGAGSAAGMNIGGQPGQHPQGLGLEFDPHHLPFDDPYLDNVNANINGLPSLPFTPSYDFETFSTTFEDPFSYPSTARAYDVLGGLGPGGAPFDMAHPCGGTLGAGDDEEGSSPQDLDNKLLGFSAPIAGAAPAVLDETSGVSVEPAMTAELFGMFFVAEDVYSSDHNVGRPLELTCYRRNLWQCSGQITLPRHVSSMVDAEGKKVPVRELAASITAKESIEGKPTEIISIPIKSSNPNATTKDGDTANSTGASDENKIAGPPPNVTIDLGAATETDGQPGRVTASVSWKRLQFKHATANNGRRKGLQQHYVVQINLLGRTIDEESGVVASPEAAPEWIKIAEIQSGPVIVRGRSPRNFDSRKDVPLTSGDKKQQQAQQQVQQQQHLQAERRRLSAENLGGLGGVMAASSPVIKQDRSDFAANMQKYRTMGNIQASQPDWASHQSYSQLSQQQHPSKKVAVSPTVSRPPVPAWSSSESITSLSGTTPTRTSSSKNNAAVPRTSVSVSTLPISLSLSEDERSPPNRDGTSTTSPQYTRAGRSGSGASSSIAAAAADAMGLHLPSISSQSDLDDDGEMLYEYFPLSLDDWMQPVDAIYRPHVVHHTNALPEAKAQSGVRQGKRYFLAE